MKLILIKCTTGCTCCYDENHYRGPYKSKEDAQRRIDSFLAKGSKFWPVSSQFAKRGHYSIYEEECEEISNGRIIFQEDLVVENKKPVEVDENGLVIDDNDFFASCR